MKRISSTQWPGSCLTVTCHDGNGPTLMGRNWLSRIKLDWPRVCHMAQPQRISQLLSQYNDLFQPGIGTLCNYEAKLDVDPDAAPKFFKPRAVPYSLRPTTGQELDKLVSMGILEQVLTSEWASPKPLSPFLRQIGQYVFVVITRSL